MGHNLGAAHVTSAQGGDCTVSIMNPSISASTSFCGFSRDQITSHTISTRDCLTPLTQPGCTYTLSQSTQNIPSGAGNSSVTVTTQAGCNWAVAEAEGWVTVTNPTGTTSSSGTFDYSVTANSCGPRTGLVSVGDQILTVIQAGNPNYLTDPDTAIAIAVGQTLNGELSATDCVTAWLARLGAINETPTWIDTSSLAWRVKRFGLR